MKWTRTVESVKGNVITLDAPITMAIDQKYGRAMVITSYNKGR